MDVTSDGWRLNAKGKLSKNAVAEGIINNVRKTIIREQLTDPRFYAEMSELLDDLIEQKRDDTEAYEEFLNRAEALVRKMGQKGNIIHPSVLNGNPEATVLYNNLESVPATIFQCPVVEEEKAQYALNIDAALREKAPAAWKGDETKERVVQNFLYELMQRDGEATLAIFEIIKNQPGY